MVIPQTASPGCVPQSHYLGAAKLRVIWKCIWSVKVDKIPAPWYYTFTHRVSREGKATGSVHLSVRLSDRMSVCFHSIFWTDWPLNLSLCVCYDHSSLGLKSRSHVKVKGRRNAVTRSVWPRSSIEDSVSSNRHEISGKLRRRAQGGGRLPSSEKYIFKIGSKIGSWSPSSSGLCPLVAPAGAVLLDSAGNFAPRFPNPPSPHRSAPLNVITEMNLKVKSRS